MKTIPHFRRTPVPALLVLLLSGGASLTIPLMVVALFDGILPQATPGLLPPVAAALCGAAVVQGLLHLAGLRGLLREGFLAAEDRGRQAWTRLVSLPLGFLQRSPPVETGTQAEAAAEAERRREEFREAAWPAVLLGLPNLGLMAFFEPTMALLSAAFVMVAAGATAGFRGRRRAALVALFTLRAVRDTGLHDAFRALAKLRLAGAEEWALRNWREKSLPVAARESAVRQSDAAAFGILAGTTALSCALVFVIGSRSQLSLGEFLGFFAAFGAFTAAVRAMATSWPIRWDAAALELQAAPLFQSPIDRPGRAPETLSGDVEVRGLSFSHSSKPVLRDISLHIRRGEMVVINGRSGSGKTTLLRLLLGFADPECGEIRYDGQSLAEFGLAPLRSRLGVVFQNPFLSPGSIFQNIAAGDDLPLEEAWHAAELAGMAGEIRSLPMGMHSLIGALGENLPAGQRQRLALARALARRPDLLFLDEPAAGLDFRTRGQIWEALADLRLTRIIFTHQKEPPNADRLFRLEGGRLRPA